MKKLSLLLALILSLSIITGCQEAASTDDGIVDETLTATQMAKKMGLGISLGNTMEAYDAKNCETIGFEWIPVVGNNTPEDYETYWGATLTSQEVIDGMKAAGFDTVRIPVFWGNMMENDGTYTINDAYMNRVREIVDYCYNADLYVVINIHHFDEFIIRRNSLDDCAVIFDNLWTQIAAYFKDYSHRLVFEGYNEYLGGEVFNKKGELTQLPRSEAYKLVNDLNQTFVDAVRATGGHNEDRVLIVCGYWTNIDLTTSPNFIMPHDTAKERLMLSVHYVDNAMYWSHKIGGQEWLDYTKSQCELLKKAFTDKGIPVFLGETTTTYPKNRFDKNPIYESSVACLEVVLNTLLEYGFVPILWDTNSHFYSRTDYIIHDAEAKELILKLSESIQE